MRGRANPAGKDVVVRTKFCLFDPQGERITSGFSDFKLDRSAGFLLHHNSPRRNVIAVTDVAHLELDQVACAKFAIYPKIEQRELPEPVLQLQTDPDSPDFF